MPSDFNERLDQLQAMIGEGLLSGKVEYDQAYAHRQHEDLQLKHEHGGQGQFLTEPLLTRQDELLQKIADKVLEEEGLKRGMTEAVEDLATSSADKVPLEHGTLRASSHPTVESNGELIYDRPFQRRLTDEELDKEHEVTPSVRERRRGTREQRSRNEFRRTHYHRGVFPGEYMLRRRLRRLARRKFRRRLIRFHRAFGRRGGFKRVLKPSGFTGYIYGTFKSRQIRVGFPGTRFTLGGAPTTAGTRTSRQPSTRQSSGGTRVRASTPRAPARPRPLAAPRYKAPTAPKQPRAPKQPKTKAPKQPRQPKAPTVRKPRTRRVVA